MLTGPRASRDDQDVLHADGAAGPMRIINTTVGRVLLQRRAAEGDALTSTALLKKKGLQQLVQNVLSALRASEATVEMLDALKQLGFTYATRSGMSIGIDDLIIPRRRSRCVQTGEQRGDQGRTAVPRGRDHQRRALQQGHRRLVGRHREDRRRDVRARWQTADEAVRQRSIRSTSWPTPARAVQQQQIRQLAGMRGLMAKPSGEIIEMPITRTSAKACTVLAVLHLDARRAQGPGRHGAQDRRLGLPDAPPGGRGAGRHHLRRRTAAPSRASRPGHRRRRRDHRAPARTASSAASRSRTIVDPISGAGDPSTSTSEIDEDDGARRSQDAGIETVKIRSVLTCASLRGVCAKCYGRDLATRQHGRHRRGGRRHRRPVDRRARHAADDAHVPHRRHRHRRASEQIAARRRAFGGIVQLRGHRQLDRPAATDKDGRSSMVMNRHAQLNPWSTRRAATRERYDAGLRRAAARSTTARWSSRGQVMAEWDPYTLLDPRRRSAGAIESRRHHRGRHRPGGGRRGHRHSRHGRAGEPRPPTRARRIEIKRRRRRGQPRLRQARARTTCRSTRTSWCSDGDEGRRRRRAWPRSRARPPRRRTSRAVCRAWSSCSRRASRRTTAVISRDRRRGQLRRRSSRASARSSSPPSDGEPQEYAGTRSARRARQRRKATASRAGRAADGRPEQPARHPRGARREGAGEPTWSTRSRRSTGCRASNINDKHIEVIVRQMMRLGADRGCGRHRLPRRRAGRAEVRSIEENQRVIGDGGPPATGAEPLLLGITKASLSTESLHLGRVVPGNAPRCSPRRRPARGKIDYLRGPEART